MSEVRNNRKTREGIVVSNKMDKTAVVKLETKTQHPIYKKIIKQLKKVKVHVPENNLNIGDEVRIVETRPLSKDKRWRLSEVIKKSSL
jgi:small subunit ribosomal protein S17